MNQNKTYMKFYKNFTYKIKNEGGLLHEKLSTQCPNYSLLDSLAGYNNQPKLDQFQNV